MNVEMNMMKLFGTIDFILIYNNYILTPLIMYLECYFDIILVILYLGGLRERNKNRTLRFSRRYNYRGA